MQPDRLHGETDQCVHEDISCCNSHYCFSAATVSQIKSVCGLRPLTACAMSEIQILPETNAAHWDNGAPKTGFVVLPGVQYPQQVRLDDKGEIMAGDAKLLKLTNIFLPTNPTES